MMDCILGDEDIANPGESCTFSCDTDYILRGSNIIGHVRIIDPGVVVRLHV